MRASLRETFWTAALIRDFAAGEKPTLFKRLGGVPVVTHHTADVDGRRPVAFDCYRTSDSALSRATVLRDGPTLIVTHGFAHEGAQDPRLQALCRRLARLGWVVIAPEFPQMSRYQLGLDDTDDLETVVMALPAIPGVNATDIGIMAFSFGAGPVLIGLARETLRERARFALVFGGYFDLHHAFRYVLTGAYDIGGLSGRVAMPTERDDRWKFLKGNLHLLPPSATRQRFAAMIEGRIADPECAVDLSRYSDTERAVFALIDNRNPDRFDALYAAAAPYLEAWVRALSPASVAASITTPLVIVHSETDQKTHYSESLALSRSVVAGPTPLVAIVNIFAHVDVSLRWWSPSALKRDVIPGVRRLWSVARVLVGGPAALGPA